MTTINNFSTCKACNVIYRAGVLTATSYCAVNKEAGHTQLTVTNNSVTSVVTNTINPAQVGTSTCQTGWAMCNKCSGLWYSGTDNKGTCYDGTAHTYKTDVTVPCIQSSTDISSDSGFHWCSVCFAMVNTNGITDMSKIPGCKGSSAVFHTIYTQSKYLLDRTNVVQAPPKTTPAADTPAKAGAPVIVSTDTPLTSQWWFWAAIGGGVLLLIIFGVFIFKGGKKKSRKDSDAEDAEDDE